MAGHVARCGAGGLGEARADRDAGVDLSAVNKAARTADRAAQLAEKEKERDGVLTVGRVFEEYLVLHHAAVNNLTPKSLFASREFCPYCRAEIVRSGGTITGPRTAVW